MALGLSAPIRADARGDPGHAARALHANLKDFRSLGGGYDGAEISWFATLPLVLPFRRSHTYI